MGSRDFKRLAIRAIRKAVHVGNKLLHKVLGLTTRVENKATRILDGTDFTIQVNDVVPFEKLYYTTLSAITPINPALPRVGQKKAVVLLLPSLSSSSFFGGTATALYAAGRLAELEKRPLRIVQTLQTGKPTDLSGFLKTAGITLPEKNIEVTSVADRAWNVYGYLPMHKDDIFIVSAWWDAYLVSKLPLTRKFIYLIQDFEPIFYNNSDQYVLAESTYGGDNFVPLCNTKLIFDFMQDRKYPAFSKGHSYFFEPAISRKTQALDTVAKKSKKQLFIYGRPDVHRNLFYTVLSALDYCFTAEFLDKSEWEFYMAGQDGLSDIKLGSGVVVKNLGKMDIDDYVKFSQGVDLAVSLMMAPHPNYPTLEFASVGAAVVTTRYANKIDLSTYSKNIVMADTTVESIAGAIRQAATLTRHERLENTEKDTISGDWCKALDTPLNAILSDL